jgi:hypothetical protein
MPAGRAFVDREVEEFTIVSLHTAERADAERAMIRLQARPAFDVRLLDDVGSTFRVGLDTSSNGVQRRQSDPTRRSRRAD